MKQILSLALALLPCLAWAQYPSNGNQKITLGEQTTADGLIWRGMAADTTKTVKTDTSAWIVLDTANSIMYHYDSSSVGRKWLRVGGSISSDMTGTLPVANGGTGSATQNFVDLTTTQSNIGGAKTFTSALTATRFNPNSSTASGTGMYLPKTNTLGFTAAGNTRFAIAPNGLSIFKSDTVQNKYTADQLIEIGAQGVIFAATGAPGQYNDYTFGMGFYFDGVGNPKYMATTSAALTHQPIRIVMYQGEFLFENAVAGTKDNLLTFIRLMTLNKNGNLGIGTSTPQVQLHTTGGVRFANLASITDLRTDADGDLFNGSDFNLKNSIDTINYGLKDVLKLKPVQFNWNDINRNLNEYKNLGFIAQDVLDVIPNAASSMGDGDMQVDYNAIVATLTKAIQEQQVLIKALEQRIINLENK